MRIIIQQGASENLLIYRVKGFPFGVGITTYQEYLDSGVKDTFLDNFFTSEHTEPYWYRDVSGKLVYRKVVNKPPLNTLVE